MLELNKIYNEDCLEGMKRIDDESIDMILCDLPYGTTACAWDVIIPFEPLWTQYKRIIKPNGAIVLTASQPFTTKLIASNLEWFKYEWIWFKSHGGNFSNTKHQPLKEHECVEIFGNPNDMVNYYPIKEHRSGTGKNTAKYAKRSNVSSSAVFNVKSKPIKKTFGELRTPSSVQFFNSVSNTNGKRIHSSEKPVALFEYLIKTYTNEGETVLDNCMGSGTTAIACIHTNRNFIGFELDKEYFKKANKRILHTNKPLF